MKVVFFVGTTAELIKVMPVMKYFSEHNQEFEVVASGQNNISNSPLLKVCHKDTSDITLSSGPAKQTSLSLLTWFFKTLWRSYRSLSARYKAIKGTRAYFIVHGDTISTVMGALLGKFLGFKVVHIEAGIRSYDWLNPFPEEIDRMIVSTIADVHCCPNEWAVGNIKNSKGVKVNTIQNTLYESLQIAKSQPLDPKYELPILKERFFVFVMHRQENVFDDNLVNYLVSQIEEVSKEIRCLFVIHPLTKEVLTKLNLLQRLIDNQNIEIVERVPYFSFMKILDLAEFLITDGGSNQEEAYYFGKPCLVLRKVTERTEGLGGNVVLSKGDYSIIKSFIQNYKKYKTPPIASDISPSKIILEALNEQKN